MEAKIIPSTPERKIEMQNLPCVDYPDMKSISINHPAQEFHYFVEYGWYCALIKFREGIAREGLLE